MAIISQKGPRNTLLKKRNLNLKGLYLLEFKALKPKITIFSKFQFSWVYYIKKRAIRIKFFEIYALLDTVINFYQLWKIFRHAVTKTLDFGKKHFQVSNYCFTWSKPLEKYLQHSKDACKLIFWIQAWKKALCWAILFQSSFAVL